MKRKAWPRAGVFMVRNKATEQLTRTGPIREGLEYQDLYGVSILMEWLEHPSRYVWVKFEANEFASLDDVVALSPEQHLRLIQIKHSSSADLFSTPFTMDELIKKPSRSENSLFRKWFTSWLDARNTGNFREIAVELINNPPPCQHP